MPLSYSTRPPYCVPVLGLCAILILLNSLHLHAQEVENKWELMNWPGSAGILASTVLDDGRIVIGTQGGGLFYSDDQGQTWIIKASEDRGLESINSLAHLGNIVFAGGPRGLYRSLDRGETWEAVNSVETGLLGYIQKLAVDGDRVYVSSGNGLDVSTNKGLSWRPLSIYLNDPNYLYLQAHDGVVYAATRGELFRYEHARDLTEIIELPFEQLHVMKFVGDRLFIGGGLWAQGKGIYLYNYEDDSWEDISANIHSNERFVSIAALGEDIYLGTDHGIYRSEGEWHWTRIHENLNKQRIQRLEVLNNKLYIGSATDGMMCYEPQTMQLELINNGLVTWPIDNIWVTEDRLLAQSTNQNLHFRRLDDTQPWIEIWRDTIFASNSVGDVIDYHGELLMGAGSLYGSNDNGYSWQRRFPEANLPAILELLPKNDQLLLYGYRDVFTFKPDGNHTSQRLDIRQNITDALVHDAYVYVASYGAGVMRSRDGTQNWEARNRGLSNLNVNMLLKHEHKLLAASDAGVFFSSGGGSSWTDVSDIAAVDGNSKSRIKKVHSILELDGYIYVVDADGVYYVKASRIGDPWQALTTRGMPADARRSCLTVNDRTLYVGTENRGIFRADILEKTAGQFSEGRGTRSELGQLYIAPQPAFNSTTVYFQLKSNANVSLAIYNVRGQLISRSSLEEYAVDREHQYALNTRALPAGAYFCSLENGESRVTYVFSVVR